MSARIPTITLCLAASLGHQSLGHAQGQRPARDGQAPRSTAASSVPSNLPIPAAPGPVVRASQAPSTMNMAPIKPPAEARPVAGEARPVPVQADSAVGSVAMLGLADFERIALQRNPTLRQAVAQTDATLHRSLQAGLYPNPTFGYLQEQIGALGESTPTSQGFVAKGKGSPGDLVGGFVQQEFITGGKLRLSRAKFAEEANAARWQAEAQGFRVINGVRMRFFEVLADQRLIQIHRDLVRLYEDAVRTTEELVNVGQANEPDLLQARVESRRSRVALRNAENRYCGDWEHLVSLAGAPEMRPVLLDDRPLELKAVPLDFDATLANLLRNSPEIQAALSEIRRSQIMVRRERAEPIPNVTVQANAGHNYEFGVTTASVNVSFPLPVFNRNQGTVREAMSDLARDHAEHERIALSLRQRLAAAATRFNDALLSVDDFRDESLPLARRAYEVQSENFRQRRATWPQVLVARRTFFDLNREYVESLLELRKAEIEINGMLLVDGLAPPSAPTSQGHIESVPQPR